MSTATLRKQDGKIHELALSEIRKHPDLQRRNVLGGTAVDMEKVHVYCEVAKSGVEFPPVECIYDSEYYWLYHGYHRVRMAELLKWPSIKAIVRPGTFRDAYFLSLHANVENGTELPRNVRLKNLEAMMNDEEWSQFTDSVIALHCGVDRDTVRKYRAELENSPGHGASHLFNSDGELVDVRPRNGRDVDEDNSIESRDDFFAKIAPDKSAPMTISQMKETRQAKVFSHLRKLKARPVRDVKTEIGKLDIVTDDCAYLFVYAGSQHQFAQQLGLLLMKRQSLNPKLRPVMVGRFDGLRVMVKLAESLGVTCVTPDMILTRHEEV